MTTIASTLPAATTDRLSTYGSVGAVASAIGAALAGGIVGSLLTARADRLSREDRELLQAAAVIGRRFAPDLLAAVRGGWQPQEEKETPTDWKAMGIVVAGLVANLVLIQPLGFTAASVIMFVLVCYGALRPRPALGLIFLVGMFADGTVLGPAFWVFLALYADAGARSHDPARQLTAPPSG